MFLVVFVDKVCCISAFIYYATPLGLIENLPPTGTGLHPVLIYATPFGAFYMIYSNKPQGGDIK